MLTRLLVFINALCWISFSFSAELTSIETPNIPVNEKWREIVKSGDAHRFKSVFSSLTKYREISGQSWVSGYSLKTGRYWIGNCKPSPYLGGLLIFKETNVEFFEDVGCVKSVKEIDVNLDNNTELVIETYGTGSGYEATENIILFFDASNKINYRLKIVKKAISYRELKTVYETHINPVLSDSGHLLYLRIVETEKLVNSGNVNYEPILISQINTLKSFNKDLYKTVISKRFRLTINEGLLSLANEL